MRSNRFAVLSLFALSALDSTVAATDVFVDTFTGGTNSSGWTYGPPSTYPTSGGNPGEYLRSVVDTYAPRLQTNAVSSPFHGNYRKSRVTEISVDLNTFSLLYPMNRECTLVLWSGTSAVHRLGTDLVPPVGAGWGTIHIPIPSKSFTMPAGWSVFPNSSTLLPNVTWNTVIQNVTKVEFFYGDPKLTFIFAIWTVGADNISITRETPVAVADPLITPASRSLRSEPPRSRRLGSGFRNEVAIRTKDDASPLCLRCAVRSA